MLLSKVLIPQLNREVGSFGESQGRGQAKLLGRLGAFIVEPLPDIVYTDIMEIPLQMFLSKVLNLKLNISCANHKVDMASTLEVMVEEQTSSTARTLRGPRLRGWPGSCILFSTNATVLKNLCAFVCTNQPQHFVSYQF